MNVHDAFRFAGAARSVKNEERVLGVHNFRRTLIRKFHQVCEIHFVGSQLRLLVKTTTFSTKSSPSTASSGMLFHCTTFAATIADVSGDDNLGVCIG
jgi:hypothetical protein